MFRELVRGRSVKLTACDRIARKQRGDRRGATAVEMAVVAPIFFLLVFGLVEFSRMTMVSQGLTDAARAGCRKAVLASTDNSTDVDATVRDYLKAVVEDADDPDMVRILVTPSTLGVTESGTEVTTTVELDYADVSWIPAVFLDDVVLRGVSTMTRE